MFICSKCDKREFQLTQLSEMRLLAECPSCGGSFILDTITEKRPRVEAADPTQHIVWDWKAEKWIPAKRN
jgi:DNA-directed RNA polymerase subunit RPC12/RpoP